MGVINNFISRLSSVTINYRTFAHLPPITRVSAYFCRDYRRKLFSISPLSGLTLGRETEDFRAFPIFFFLNIDLASHVRKAKCARSRFLNISNILNISLLQRPKILTSERKYVKRDNVICLMSVISSVIFNKNF